MTTYESLETDADLAPASWKINPESLSPEAQALWAAENQTPIIIDTDTSLRPKILDACGMTCVFCHNEGTPVASRNSLGRVSIYANTNGVNFLPGRMKADQKLYDSLATLRNSVGIEELHLTGGEPTLHPELPEIIALAKSLGLSVKMTSNGENPKAFEPAAKAGLDKVVFSVFGTTAEELAQVQHAKYRDPSLAERKIKSLHQSIENATGNGITAVANVVIPDESHRERVTHIIERFNGLSLRLLNSLDDGEQSFTAIYEILASLEAEPHAVKITAGSSNTRVKYKLPDGGDISFKQIRPARFDHICRDCQIDQAGKCEEGFYGLRLYVNQAGEYLLGFCLQRMDLTMHIEEFAAGELPGQLMSFREQERKIMEDYFYGS